MPLDLLVIHPGAAHGIYGALGDELTAVEPPAWARMIAAYVRNRGHSVEILDAEALMLAPKEIANRVRERDPRLVCLAVYGHQPSASTQQMHAAGLAAQEIYAAAGHIETIMVGGHVSALPERTLIEEAVDYACIGEGAATIVGLLEDRLIEKIPGLVWWDWDGATIRCNPPADPLPMSELSGDAWDLLPMDRYRAHNWQVLDGSPRQPYASLYTTLGCPYSCSFCCINAPFGGPGYRTREPASVVEEIRMLHDAHGVRTLKIVDEMFVLKPSHYVSVCEGLAALPFADEMNIWCYARVDTVRSDRLELLRRAGIRWLALGIESASAYVRDGSNKRLRESDILGVVRAIQSNGINVIGNFIFGLPDDDMDSMRATLDLAHELNCEWANFYCAQAYPGSALHTEALKQGWTLPSSWRGYSQHNDECRPLDTLHVGAADVLQFRDEAFRAYFGSARYQDLIADKFDDTAVAHVNRMLEYRLERKLLREVA